MTDFHALAEHIQKRISLTEAETNEILSCFKLEKVRRRQFIIQPGFIAHHKSYVLKGAFRAYVVDETGQDHTIQVSIEDWWISDYNSYVFQLSDATAGGVWSSNNSNESVAGAGTLSTVTGITAGNNTITYQLGNGCYVTYPMIINPNPTSILGNFNACIGSTTSLSDATSGSLSWTSSTPGVATIANSGVLTPVAVGTTTITYKIVTGSCYTTQVITVNAVPVISAIQGPVSISHATPATLSDATAGGVWSSSNASIIALTGSTGSPIGATAIASSGSAVISYTVTNAAGCKATVAKTVSAAPAPPHHGSTGVEPTINAGSGVALYPNPTSGTVNIKADVGGVFYLYALDGKTLGEYKVVLGITNIALPDKLAKGIYMGRYVGEDESTAMFKIVKE